MHNYFGQVVIRRLISFPGFLERGYGGENRPGPDQGSCLWDHVSEESANGWNQSENALQVSLFILKRLVL